MTAPRRGPRSLVPPAAPLVLVWGLGITELLLVVVLGVLFFGARKIPLIARGLGEGIRNFKGELGSPDEDDDEDRRLREEGGDAADDRPGRPGRRE